MSITEQIRRLADLNTRLAEIEEDFEDLHNGVIELDEGDIAALEEEEVRLHQAILKLEEEIDSYGSPRYGLYLGDWE